jgi:hypothetical protein
MAAPAMQAIGNVTLSAASATVTFSNIPQTYRDLRLVITGSNTVGNVYGCFINLNGDSGSNYYFVRAHGDGSSAVTQSGNATTFGMLGWSTLGTIANFQGDFLDANATDKHKVFLGRGSDPAGRVAMFANRWANTAAITSITIIAESASSWTAGSTFTLYGVLA